MMTTSGAFSSSCCGADFSKGLSFLKYPHSGGQTPTAASQSRKKKEADRGQQLWTHSGTSLGIGIERQLGRTPGGGSVDASSENCSEQPGLEFRTIRQREGQLESLDSIISYSLPLRHSYQSLTLPLSEDNFNAGCNQVFEDQADSLVSSDTYQAAWALFQLSGGTQN
ncbi:uncharacterized protein LOC102352354 [Latimeria chalumnae]|uniref:uncharacterized protein LOC102352354 n=1 Tax=Latimeria chalumnae TaxID=7897 RepID=UPI00313C1006